MKKILFISFAFALTCESIAQVYLQPQSIKIGNIGSQMQFSAMAWKGRDTLFMFAQREPDKFYYALRDSIEASLINNDPLKLNSISVKGLGQFKKDHKYYDGIEACVIKGNTFFISIESKINDTNCYVLKGHFTGNTVVFENQTFASIKKPNKYKKDDGFESLVEVGNNTLLAFFERNISETSRHGYKIDTNLSVSNTRIRTVTYKYARAERQRIAEICKYNDTTFYGIDFLYRPIDSIKKEPCHSKLVKLTINNTSIEVSPVSYLFYCNDTCANYNNLNCINFEGMARLGDGILVISDDDPSDDNCTHLYYYKLDNVLKK